MTDETKFPSTLIDGDTSELPDGIAGFCATGAAGEFAHKAIECGWRVRQVVELAMMLDRLGYEIRPVEACRHER